MRSHSSSGLARAKPQACSYSTVTVRSLYQCARGSGQVFPCQRHRTSGFSATPQQPTLATAAFTCSSYASSTSSSTQPRRSSSYPLPGRRQRVGAVQCKALPRSNNQQPSDPAEGPNSDAPALNQLNLSPAAAAAAGEEEDVDYSDLDADDNIILLGSEEEEEDAEYDSYNDVTGTSSSSRRAAAAGGGPSSQVISDAMGEEDFQAAMAAARQQVLSGSSSDEDDGWGAEEEEQEDTLQRSGEDFWSSDKERVYLVGVTYKQQYQQQQRRQQRQQQQQQQRLFGCRSSSSGTNSSSSSMPRLGDVGMASSYSPWAAEEGADGNGSSRSSSKQPSVTYSIQESLEELGRLAETAGLQVVGSSYQSLESPNNSTYIGSGKVAEVAAAITALKVDTVIFDDELSPGQLRNLEKALSGGKQGLQVSVADRTALILDIFSQRARTREGKLQVELAQTEYQLPRLTRMWTHLDRVAGGGQVKGAGEKQIEIDKRLLRDKAAALRRELQAVRTHRAAHRTRRSDAPIPVVALVGYTNAGKSTLLNTLTAAGVLAEDKLFATLDPTTRKVRLDGNLEVLFSDTVGFIQKLPTQLVAAFRATLEEIAAAAVVLHVLDVSAPNAAAQCAAVLQVLEELGVQDLPLVTAWNKIDACPVPDAVRALAGRRPDTVAISGANGEGMAQLMGAIAEKLAESMVEVEVLLPYSAGALLDDLHKMGKVTDTVYTEQGTHVTAHVPRCLVGKLQQYEMFGGSTATGGTAGAAYSGTAAGGTVGSVSDDEDNGQLGTLSEDEMYADFVVDNGSLEGVVEEGWEDDNLPTDGSNGGDMGMGWSEQSEDESAAAVGKGVGSNGQQLDPYQPHSIGSRAGKRAERQRKQQMSSSLSQHQLPVDWQELMMSGSSAASSVSSTSSV